MARSTKEEKQYKYHMQRFLSEQGYPAYADFLDDVIFHLTENPGVIGYMTMEDTPYEEAGTIVINKNLDEEQMSLIIRHEILHGVLEHGIRLSRKFGGLSMQDIRSKPKQRDRNGNFIDNVAGDYEISNLGYTDKDKSNVRAIKLNGQILRGLVTEDDHPGWEDLSFEEMYDKLSDEIQDEKEDMKDDIEESEEKRSDEYVDGWNQAMKDFADGKITADDIQDILNKLQSGGDIDV